MGIYGDLRGFKGLQGVTRVRGIARDYRVLQGVTRGYRGLQWITGGYKGLQKVTGGYN